ncbi:Importin subunit alpha [Operophtera brumata]|uniref:Importin subunit alpha n=1 Tax=Operophtera brumata TaxID=104452 RepID=A0A0L7L5A3_OPEBR|nr:Importin subunit alpha [Operophtera brumata]
MLTDTAWAITNLCLGGTAEQLDTLVSAGFLEPYCGLLVSPDHRAVLLILDGLNNLLQVTHTRTVCNIHLCLGGTAEQLDTLVSAGLLEPYCALLMSPDHRAVLLILDGLNNLLQVTHTRTVCNIHLCLGGTAEQLDTLVSAGLLERYCALLMSPDHRAVLLILDGLNNLLQVTHTRTVCNIHLCLGGTAEQLDTLLSAGLLEPPRNVSASIDSAKLFLLD